MLLERSIVPDMSGSFGWIFWGLLLSHFHFQINGVDLMPDVLGYGFVALGCHGLAKLSSGFKRAGVLSLVLAVFALMDHGVRDWHPMIMLARSGGDIAVVWLLLGGVIRMAESSRWEILFLQASRRRVAYAILATSVAMLEVTGLEGELPFPGLGLALSIAIMVSVIFVLILVHRVKLRVRQAVAHPLVA